VAERVSRASIAPCTAHSHLRPRRPLIGRAGHRRIGHRLLLVDPRRCVGVQYAGASSGPDVFRLWTYSTFCHQRGAHASKAARFRPVLMAVSTAAAAATWKTMGEGAAGQRVKHLHRTGTAAAKPWPQPTSTSWPLRWWGCLSRTLIAALAGTPLPEVPYGRRL
jgi:hypothetical protein